VRILPFLLTLGLACGSDEVSETDAATTATATATGTPTATARVPPVDAPEAEPVEDEDPGPVTGDNWKSHPSVVEIREIVTEINEGAANSKSGWSVDEQIFDDICGLYGPDGGGAGPHILESTLVKDDKGRTRSLKVIEIGGDIGGDMTQFYDEAGQLRFAMSEYSHSGAESKYLSRLYLNADGSKLFEPEVEMLSENPGPGDSDKIADIVAATARDAVALHKKTTLRCSK